MKFFLFFLSTLLLSSCSFTQNKKNTFEDRFVEIEAPSSTELIERSGTLSTKDLSVSSRATHILITEDTQEILLLQSNTLSLQEFENKEVLISGSFKKIFEENIFDIELIELKEEEKENTEEQEIEWKSFQDTEKRISFSYPDIWKLSSKRKIITIKNPEDKTILKTVRLINKNNAALSAFANTAFTEVTVNNKRALRVEKSANSEDIQFDLYFSGSEEVIKLSLQYTAESTEEELVLKILNTLNIAEEIQKFQTCGGTDNILCEQGFRCEFTRINSGICIPVDK